MVYVGLCCYALCVLLANVFLDSFIALPVFGQLSIGTIFFGAIFTLRDHLHQSGLKYVYAGIALSLVITLTYNIIYDIPPRFIIASFVSLLVSELTNTAVFQHYIKQSWYKKVFKSNAVSVPVDSTLFTLMAFYGDMPLFSKTDVSILAIIFADVIFKMLVASLIVIIPKDFFVGKKQKKNSEVGNVKSSDPLADI